MKINKYKKGQNCTVRFKCAAVVQIYKVLQKLCKAQYDYFDPT